MQRRNFLASLAALFAVGKLPKVEEDFELGEIYPSSLPNDYYYHHQFSRWVRIKAAEPIDVGALVYIDNDGKAREITTKKGTEFANAKGVCMLNNWPEDVVVALYN